VNQDHVVGAAVTGAPSAIVMLAAVLEHFQGVDAATAGSEAGLILLALGAVAGFARALLARPATPQPAGGQG
jgi:hypothetical protein